jgi:mRNA-degrading endonuclease RelE of RelBE toxin-antitoxin system
MREFEIKPELEKKIIKISKKDKIMFERIMKKIEDIVNSEDITHYKNLRNEMKELKRVHIGHFVLVFSYVNTKDIFK